MAAVGYAADTPVLQRLNLRIDPDDRIALLGRNGNGKTTLARLLAAQLAPMAGEVHASGKMRVGYFTQYQVEELHGDDTPLQHMTRAMDGKTPGAVRAQLGRFGFSGDKATTRVDKLSGGERARLALALITRDAPHLLILDEPTNHLDVDSREALVQALNGYDGAVILVSHDRHMVELTADRLVLVDDGGATDYAGSIDDYIDFVLGRNQPKEAKAPKQAKADRKADARSREEARALKNRRPRPKRQAPASPPNVRRSTARCSIPPAPSRPSPRCRWANSPNAARPSPPSSKPPRRAGSRSASSLRKPPPDRDLIEAVRQMRITGSDLNSSMAVWG